MRILIVDDHPLVRSILLERLQHLGAGVTTAAAQDADAAMRQLLDQHFDLMLLDVMMPGIDGLAFLGVVRKRFPSLNVVILSAMNDPDTVRRALRYGASGFIPKDCSSNDLLAALRRILAGAVIVPAYVQAAHKSRSLEQRYGLSAAQMRVLELLGNGKSTREIAELLAISEGTVRIHISAILKLLKVHTRNQAILVVNKKQASRLLNASMFGRQRSVPDRGRNNLLVESVN